MTDESQLADGKNAAERLNRCREELASLQSRSEKLAAEEAQLLPWESFTMPLECATTEKVLIQMGTLPAAVRRSKYMRHWMRPEICMSAGGKC